MRHVGSLRVPVLRLFLMMLACLLSVTSAHAQPFAYVVNTTDGTVSVIDTATNQVDATVIVGAQPIVGVWISLGSRASVYGLPVTACEVCPVLRKTVAHVYRP